MKITTCIVATAIILALSAVPTLADSSATFDMTGTFQVCALGASCALGTTPTGNFSGSLTIDTTTGKVTSFSVSDPTSFGGACDIALFKCGLIVDTLLATDAGGDSFRVGLLESSLVGVTALSAAPSLLVTGGDEFFDNTHPSDACNPAAGDYCEIDTIKFTAAPSPTPEPSSLALLGSGIVALAGLFGRKRLA
jgi:hypothetical protein